MLKKFNKLKRNHKGISTVIATIIIVAIAIVMAIAVAYWAMGIGTSFTRFEKLQYTSTYMTTTGTGATSADVINIGLKNTGTATATFTPSAIELNGVPISAYAADDYMPTVAFTGTSLAAGQSATGTITLPTGAADSIWQSGMNVQITILSAAGNQYPSVVVLP